MNTIYILIIVFFNQVGELQGGVVRFPSPQTCEAGAVQAQKDFFPLKINTTCLPIEAPGEDIKIEKKPKQKYSDT